MWAAHNGRTVCVRQLLKLGANKNAKDKVRRLILCFECLSRFACIDLITVQFVGPARVRAFSSNNFSAHVF
jgi:ankyrin repeat protein